MINSRIKMLKNFFRENAKKKTVPEIVKSVRNDKITYLDEDALKEIYYTVEKIETEGIEGDLIEAGCALGGSAIVIAAAKKPLRNFYVYDVFGMIPPPSVHDEVDVHDRYEVIKSGSSEGISGEKYYGYECNLYDKVVENFSKNGIITKDNNIYLVKGLFEETMNINKSVAFAHIDGDWYESVKTCLERITPNLVSGGIMIIDDYDAWSGCRKAVDVYFSDKLDQYKFLKKSRLHILKK